MNKNFSFDVMTCLDKIYGRMKDNYSFAYPDDNFSSDRAHQVLCRFGVFYTSLNTIFSKTYIIPDNEVENIFFQQVVANAKIIGFDKEWAYPNETLSLSRAPSALNCIESSLKNYRSSISLLGNYCFREKQAQFNLLNFIENLSCTHFYNYAYPNDLYSGETAHPAFQMLLTFTENIIFVIQSIKTDDDEIKKILTNSSQKITNAKENLLTAYPNNSFRKEIGHQCLSKFIASWKNFKESSVTELKNYFEKQAIIEEYESKLNLHTEKAQVTFNKPEFVEEKVVEPVPEVSTTVVRKVKSLL